MGSTSGLHGGNQAKRANLFKVSCAGRHLGFLAAKPGRFSFVEPTSFTSVVAGSEGCLTRRWNGGAERGGGKRSETADLNGTVSAFCSSGAVSACGRVETGGAVSEDAGYSSESVNGSVLSESAGQRQCRLCAGRSRVGRWSAAGTTGGCGLRSPWRRHSCSADGGTFLRADAAGPDSAAFMDRQLGAGYGKRAVCALRRVLTALFVLAVMVFRLSLSVWSLHRHVSSELKLHCMEMCLHVIHIIHTIHLLALCTVCLMHVVL